MRRKKPQHIQSRAVIVSRSTVRRAPPAIDVTKHLEWCKIIAQGVRKDYRFRRGSDEEAELVAFAWFILVQAATRFNKFRCPPGGDLDGLFRGWVSRQIRHETRRYAERIRNGGTYHTRKGRNLRPIIVESLTQRCTPAGDKIELADPRTLTDPIEEDDGA